MSHERADVPGPTPSFGGTTGATIVVPYEDLLAEAVDSLESPDHAVRSASGPPARLTPLSEEAPVKRRLPAWVFVAFGFLGALVAATLLTGLALVIGLLVYYQPWAG